MYRILDDDNLFSTGFYDYFDRDGVILTEWSENITYALPENRYDIVFEKTGDSGRIIKIIKRD
jgi:tRNA threonylcarbamoyladenosine biosynthesis protein TsaE